MTTAALLSHQLTGDSITSLYVRGRWYNICSFEYLGELHVGKLKLSASSGTYFMPEMYCKDWVKVETTENEIVYFSVNSISGVKTDGPSGG